MRRLVNIMDEPKFGPQTAEDKAGELARAIFENIGKLREAWERGEASLVNLQSTDELAADAATMRFLNADGSTTELMVHRTIEEPG